MAMGKVVISTNIGGPKEIISNGINGYLIPPNRPNTLSLKIIEILQSIQLNKKISQEANKAVKARFEAKLITQKIERLYRQITEQRGIA
jgi:glycosyltransferase involved in cell wall biosynthesis